MPGREVQGLHRLPNSLALNSDGNEMVGGIRPYSAIFMRSDRGLIRQRRSASPAAFGQVRQVNWLTVL